MDKKEQKLTVEQEAAINYRGGSLLVSSAAGSGKTMVLVERLLSYINDGYNIDDFLVITYTRAAAGELRERIYKRLQQKLAEQPGKLHLRRQMMLCRGANIDTIHTFCTGILRENAHLIGLAPDFRVADEYQCELIKEEILNVVFSRTYERNYNENGLKLLVDMYIDGRDDRKLMQIVKEIHMRLMSTPNPKKWIDTQISNSEIKKVKDISETQFGGYLICVLKNRLSQLLDKALVLQEHASLEPKFDKCYGDSISDLVEGIRVLKVALSKSWDEAVRHKTINISKAKAISGYNELKDMRAWCRDELAKIIKYLDACSSEHIIDLKLLNSSQKVLLQLVLDFENEYALEKRKRGIVDFSDLEHLTLSLLIEEKTGRKTQIAKSISKRFKEILVDEYQDVNEVQEKIFTSLSDNESNIFMVGDVKQSIYRFRLAEPEIFLKKYDNFTNYDEKMKNKSQSGAIKINLSVNFRSNPGILEVTNHIFNNIMSKQFGEMEYTTDVSLQAGRNEKKGIQGKKGKQGHVATVEFDILSTDNEDTQSDEENRTIIEQEAEYIAGRIKILIDSNHLIEDESGETRSAKYSDIAILLRSTKGKVWRYAQALNMLEIPSQISNNEEFFETIEIQTAMSFLMVIDNPIQDIPLAATLSGLIYNLTSSELAEIRATDMKACYYDALKRAAEHNIGSSETAVKCKEILADLDVMRRLALTIPSDRFIWHVYNKTKLLEKVRTISGGERRFDNLLNFVQLAKDFESNGYKGVYKFITYINKLYSRGCNITGQSDDADKGVNVDAVKIMSIHKSKGLEFPIVILANTAKTHNMTDLNKPVVFHKDLGIGSQIIYPEKRIKCTTLAREAIKEKLRSEMLSEELRVLYVAMTRAKEKLIITATFKDAEQKIMKNKIPAGIDGKYTPQSLMSMNSTAQWIIAGTKNLESESFKINIVQASGYINCKAVKTPITATREIITDYIQDDYQYDEFNKKTRLPSKLTITALKSIADPEAENASWVKFANKYSQENVYYKKPSFIIDKKKNGGTARGTAIHNIMRYIDYNKCSTERQMRNELIRLDKLQLISSDDIYIITNDDINMINNLFKTKLGKRMMVSRTLKREFKFSLLTPASKFYHDDSNDEILIQGIIDCYFEEDDEIVIVDFKTDRVDENTIKERVKEYTPQLIGYSEALERMCKKRVKERYIYFFETNSVISV